MFLFYTPHVPFVSEAPDFLVEDDVVVSMS